MSKLFLISFFFIGMCFTVGCSTTTTSNLDDDRSQLLLIPSELVNSASEEAYAKDLSDAGSTLNKDKKFVKRVNVITERLIKETENIRSDSKDWKWEVNTIDRGIVNAYCRPGGKIIVYTGINNVLKLTDDELAVIIGHEMAHALREHTRETASQQILKSSVIGIGSLFIGDVADVANVVAEVGIILPYSREMEFEADTLGLELVYKAGYDPQAAVSLMQKLSDFEKKVQAKSTVEDKSLISSLTSTHPPTEERIVSLQQIIDDNGLNKNKTTQNKAKTK